MSSQEIKPGSDAPGSDEATANDFYCEKCYEMINYFIGECQTMSPKVTKLKALNSVRKRDNEQYKAALELLQFDYDEMKALKEDYEERYSSLIKFQTNKQPVRESTPIVESDESVGTQIEPVFERDLKRRLSEKLEKLESNFVVKNEESGQEIEKFESVEVVNTITLDLNYLTRQFFSETKCSNQKLLEYFGRKILEAKESDHKRHLEIKYEPSSKKKCTDSDIELRAEINELQRELKEAKEKIAVLSRTNETEKNQKNKKQLGNKDYFQIILNTLMMTVYLCS